MKRKRIYITAAAICACLTCAPAVSIYAQDVLPDEATEVSENSGQMEYPETTEGADGYDPCNSYPLSEGFR